MRTGEKKWRKKVERECMTESMRKRESKKKKIRTEKKKLGEKAE